MEGSNPSTDKHTIGNIGDSTQDVLSADLFISLWWADKGLADHCNVDFGTNTPAAWLWDNRAENCDEQQHDYRSFRMSINHVQNKMDVAGLAGSPAHCRGPQRNCRPARCRGRSHCWPRSSSWQTGIVHPSETQATPAATHIISHLKPGRTTLLIINTVIVIFFVILTLCV